MYYGCNLRKVRLGRGLTLKKLSQKSGVCERTLSRLELSLGDPKISTLDSVAKFLEMTVDDLFLKDWRDEIAS